MRGTKAIVLRPPEGVAGTVLEVEPPELVADEDVTRPEASVALPPNVVNDLPTRRLRVVGVAVEVPDRMIALDQADELSRLTRAAPDAKAVGIPDLFPGFSVDLDEAEGEEGREEDRDETDGADDVLVVD